MSFINVENWSLYRWEDTNSRFECWREGGREFFDRRRKICHAGWLDTPRTSTHLLSPLIERGTNGGVSLRNVFGNRGERERMRAREATRESSVKNANRVKRSAAIFLATYVTGVETTRAARTRKERAEARRRKSRSRISGGIATMANPRRLRSRLLCKLSVWRN